jgi:hypothetical protein
MIREKTIPTEIIIDLTGPAGNAFALMGQARSFAKQLGYSQQDIDTLINDMKAGDYENLIQVFDKHFGHFVILEQ